MEWDVWGHFLQTFFYRKYLFTLIFVACMNIEHQASRLSKSFMLYSFIKKNHCIYYLDHQRYNHWSCYISCLVFVFHSLKKVNKKKAKFLRKDFLLFELETKRGCSLRVIWWTFDPCCCCHNYRVGISTCNKTPALDVCLTCFYICVFWSNIVR